MEYTTYIDNNVKCFRSNDFNYNFNLKTGYTETWGKSFDDDPDFCPYGPVILDLEISEKCSMGCPFCYKANVASSGRNMSFETFVQILDVMPPTLTQIAFGVGDLSGNPDIWKIMEYSREHNIIPNITIHGKDLTDEEVNNLVKYCGAVSVSRYDNENICYDAIKRLKDAGLQYVNIHQLLSQESAENCFKVLDDIQNDERLKDLNAVVFLALKKKGRGTNMNRMNNETYEKLISKAINNNIRFGFDSCSANRFAQTVKKLFPKKYEEISCMIEPCESSMMSAYGNVEGKFFPCSFAEDVTEGIDITKVKDFVDEVWFNHSVCGERQKLLCNSRSCIYFEV